jgi:sec-independent protein translocase protein TatA
MGRIGGTELLLIILLALLLFGAGRLSDIGKGLGEGIRNFKKGIKEESDSPEAKPLDVKPGESGKKA